VSVVLLQVTARLIEAFAVSSLKADTDAAIRDARRHAQHTSGRGIILCYIYTYIQYRHCLLCPPFPPPSFPAPPS
jgi:hypothetical protein